MTVPFDNDDALADALTRSLTDDVLRQSMAGCAAVSAERSWPQVGQLIHGLLNHVVDDRWAEAVHNREFSAVELSRWTDAGGTVGSRPREMLSSSL